MSDADTEQSNVVQLRTMSALISRMQLAQRAGLQYDGNRNLYQVFGYKTKLTAADFLGKYYRQDIATRIIDAPPGATWSNPPIIEEDAAQEAWKAINRKVKIWSAMYRADRLARLNSFSIMVFGFDDATKLDQPLAPGKVKELLYIRAFGERSVKDITYITDQNNPKYGFPEVYNLSFDTAKTKSTVVGSTVSSSERDVKVHHSRVVHIVENALEDQVFGNPIMEKCFNLLDDLLKISGGTAETYWLTGNRGIQADIDKDMQVDPDDAAALSDEIDEYMHQLRRFIRTRGVKLNVLDSKPPSPKDVFSMLMALISGTTGIPQRILIGSEAGQLASEQDRANWAERIEERRALFAEPEMLEPTVDLLQLVKLLPEGEIVFEWPDAFVQNPLEKSQTMAQTARAIGNISRQTGNKAPMQLTSRTEGREILQLKGDLAESEILEIPDEGGEDTGGNVTAIDDDKPPKPANSDDDES